MVLISVLLKFDEDWMFSSWNNAIDIVGEIHLDRFV